MTLIPPKPEKRKPMIPGKKRTYTFEVNEDVDINMTQSLRARKDGIPIDVTAQIVATDGKPDASADKGDPEREDFIAEIEVDKVYEIDGKEWTVTKATKKKVTLETDDETDDMTPIELYDAVQAS